MLLVCSVTHMKSDKKQLLELSTGWLRNTSLSIQIVPMVGWGIQLQWLSKIFSQSDCEAYQYDKQCAWHGMAWHGICLVYSFSHIHVLKLTIIVTLTTFLCRPETRICIIMYVQNLINQWPSSYLNAQLSLSIASCETNIMMNVMLWQTCHDSKMSYFIQFDATNQNNTMLSPHGFPCYLVLVLCPMCTLYSTQTVNIASVTYTDYHQVDLISNLCSNCSRTRHKWCEADSPWLSPSPW